MRQFPCEVYLAEIASEKLRGEKDTGKKSSPLLLRINQSK
jgi:hypothetical protein